MKPRCRVVTTHEGDEYGRSFVCPGCLAFAKANVANWSEWDAVHVVPTTGSKAWAHNGSLELPTFSPSILVYEVKREDGSVFSPRCHSFVTGGRIQFLEDCGHPLKGQTVEMPEDTRKE